MRDVGDVLQPGRVRDMDFDMKLFEAELHRHDWQAMTCGCGGSAGHLQDDLRRLAHAVTDDEASIGQIVDHFTGPSVLLIPAPAVISCSFAALQYSISLPAQRAFLSLIIMAAEPGGVTDDPQSWGRDLNDECETAAREGLWYLYGQLVNQQDPTAASLAYLILRAIENTTRAARLREIIGDRLLPQYRDS